MKKISFYILIASISLILPNLALAHKINVFAYEEGGKVYCESTFSGGRPVKNASIKVIQLSDGSELISQKTDENGKFAFDIILLADISSSVNVVVQSDDGHKNSWKLNPIDWGGTPMDKTRSPVSSLPQISADETAKTITAIDHNQIDQIVRKAIHDELAPIKRQLLENQQQDPGVKDIAAGLGYIFGLAGLIAVFTSRKRKRNEE